MSKFQPSKNQNAGFTLIELLVCLIIGSILLSIMGGNGLKFYRLKIAKAQEVELANYAQKAGIRPISCTTNDSDGDGYVSCDAETIPTITGEKSQPVTLDCSYGLFETGCKIVNRAKITGGINGH